MANGAGLHYKCNINSTLFNDNYHVGLDMRHGDYSGSFSPLQMEGF